MSCQMIGNKVVNALSQILVGRLEINSREVGLEGSCKWLVILPEARLLQLRAPSDPPRCSAGAAAALWRRQRLKRCPPTSANEVCMTVHARPASGRSPPKAGLRLCPRGRERSRSPTRALRPLRTAERAAPGQARPRPPEPGTLGSPRAAGPARPHLGVHVGQAVAAEDRKSVV